MYAQTSISYLALSSLDTYFTPYILHLTQDQPHTHTHDTCTHHYELGQSEKKREKKNRHQTIRFVLNSSSFGFQTKKRNRMQLTKRHYLHKSNARPPFHIHPRRGQPLRHSARVEVNVAAKERRNNEQGRKKNIRYLTEERGRVLFHGEKKPLFHILIWGGGGERHRYVHRRKVNRGSHPYVTY